MIIMRNLLNKKGVLKNSFFIFFKIIKVKTNLIKLYIFLFFNYFLVTMVINGKFKEKIGKYWVYGNILNY